MAERRVVAAACLALSPLFAHGDVTPARLREDKYSIESLLEVPGDLEHRRYDVHCDVHVQSTGRPGYCSCYALDATVPRKLVDAVSRAGIHSRFVPATRDGEPIDIHMTVMVRVLITPRESLVLTLPNNGIEYARYGLLYLAPQRLNEFYWGGGEPYFNDHVSNPDVLLWQEFWIDEHGAVTDTRLTNRSGASAAVVKEFGESVARMRFIPGFCGGKPMPMHYAEPVSSGN